MLKKSFKFLGWTLFGIITFLLLYLIDVSDYFKNHSEFRYCKIEEKDAVPIYILSNGVHTDIVVPVKNEVKDWRNEIQFNQTQSKDSLMNFIAFRMGRQRFLLDTPEWSDLKASTALKAAFGVSSSAMHTTFFKSNCEKVTIANAFWFQKKTIKNLVNYISKVSVIQSSTMD